MNFQLYNDKIWTFILKSQNLAGVVSALPATAGATAVSSNPASLAATATNTPSGALHIILTPKVQVSPGVIVTVSSVGMVPASFVVDIVADPNLLSVVVDIDAADITTAPQNVPVAPGP